MAGPTVHWVKSFSERCFVVESFLLGTPPDNDIDPSKTANRWISAPRRGQAPAAAEVFEPAEDVADVSEFERFRPAKHRRRTLLFSSPSECACGCSAARLGPADRIRRCQQGAGLGEQRLLAGCRGARRRARSCRPGAGATLVCSATPCPICRALLPVAAQRSMSLHGRLPPSPTNGGRLLGAPVRSRSFGGRADGFRPKADAQGRWRARLLTPLTDDDESGRRQPPQSKEDVWHATA